ncbi:acyl-CoA Delta(11) desaturase [Vanessa tameamea]|uniref:Acyl-CoA Delta(11) desaturase n=1 Tax=Vanessa tameamea TaxID=334116 RepID=A0A8B8IT82_VANTA|nr:acyl-CoA Delta(11) desaturase-like [Vanessa tameamea]
MMPSSIITLTKKSCDDGESIECSLQARQRDKMDVNMAYKINDYYDEALPKNEFKLMAPIRRWEKRMGFVTPIRWTSSTIITLFHIVVVLYNLHAITLDGAPLWKTLMFSLFCGGVSGFGVTAGVHRYWTHRSFKAKIPLQIIMMICFSHAGQNNIPNWVRDHRLHHKMSETSADPHDANRGFFFAHMGWLMMKKHPHVIREGNKIYMSDILNDPLIKFHTKYFNVLKYLLCFILPTLIPVFLWGETIKLAVGNTLLRYLLSLHFTWSVNSFAHLWGNKPYDVKIMPTENWKVSLVAMGEGWHNYHHSFPWDYKAAELAYFLNLTTFYIDCFASIGWAYDLKRASPLFIKTVINSRGPKEHNH